MGKQKSSSPKTSPYEQSLANIANTMFAESTPIRQALTGQYEGFLQGGYDPESLPGYAPLYATARSGVEDQYGVAKENVMSNTARGGGLSSALNNLEMSRAEDVGSLPAQISSGLIQDIMNKSYGVGFNTPQSAMQGLSSAAGTYGGRLNQQQAANAQAQQANMGVLGSLGSAITMGLMLK